MVAKTLNNINEIKRTVGVKNVNYSIEDTLLEV